MPKHTPFGSACKCVVFDSLLLPAGSHVITKCSESDAFPSKHLILSRTLPSRVSLGATEQPKRTISKRMADFRADSTPSCFCIINSGRPPLIGEGGEHMPLTFWPSVVDELRFPVDSVELNHHDLISSSTPCLVPCVLLWYEQVWKS